MLSYVLMRVLEKVPDRYDSGISLLTAGKLNCVHREIAGRHVKPGNRVLDIGCGSGDLAILAARRGATVVAIDRSVEMLAVAREKITGEALCGSIDLIQMDALDMDTNFEDACFDVVTSTLAFSELTAEEVDFILRESARVLRRHGTLVVADEVVPRRLLPKLLYHANRIPAVILSYVLARTTSGPVECFRERIEKAGFVVSRVDAYLGGSLELIVAQMV